MIERQVQGSRFPRRFATFKTGGTALEEFGRESLIQHVYWLVDEAGYSQMARQFRQEANETETPEQLEKLVREFVAVSDY